MGNWAVKCLSQDDFFVEAATEGPAKECRTNGTLCSEEQAKFARRLNRPGYVSKAECAMNRAERIVKLQEMFTSGKQLTRA